jgi:hypothetical protein
MTYPSVTQVLSVYQDFSMVPEHVLTMASERGTRVHAICASIAQGLFVSQRIITPDVEGYIESFKKWFKYVEEVVFVEGELVDSELGFLGHPDLIIRMQGDQFLTLTDLKTPAIIGKTWRAQCAAYKHLAMHKFKIKRTGTLRLKQNGGFPIFDEYSDTIFADLAAFMSALNAWRYFKGDNN